MCIRDRFITAKRIEGCSEKTLKYYRKTIESMLFAIAKKASQVTTEDLRKYPVSYTHLDVYKRQDMGMEVHLRSPCVEDEDIANFCAEMSGVFRQFPDRCGCRKMCIRDSPCIPPLR